MALRILRSKAASEDGALPRLGPQLDPDVLPRPLYSPFKIHRGNLGVALSSFIALPSPLMQCQVKPGDLLLTLRAVKNQTDDVFITQLNNNVLKQSGSNPVSVVMSCVGFNMPSLKCFHYKLCK